MAIAWVGLLGLGLMSLAWILSTVKTIKTRTSGFSLWFSVLNTIGGIFMIEYSFIEANTTFAVLSTLVAASALIEVRYKLLEVQGKPPVVNAAEILGNGKKRGGRKRGKKRRK
ncbi:hypothetical protein HY993_02605 [Candidatus Micrarchaeota archaeon]|nr:hypothetical protein [Candidatus Micrarchaeota archaeon]